MTRKEQFNLMPFRLKVMIKMVGNKLEQEFPKMIVIECAVSTSIIYLGLFISFSNIDIIISNNISLDTLANLFNNIYGTFSFNTFISGSTWPKEIFNSKETFDILKPTFLDIINNNTSNLSVDRLIKQAKCPKPYIYIPKLNIYNIPFFILGLVANFLINFIINDLDYIYPILDTSFAIFLLSIDSTLNILYNDSKLRTNSSNSQSNGYSNQNNGNNNWTNISNQSNDYNNQNNSNQNNSNFNNSQGDDSNNPNNNNPNDSLGINTDTISMNLPNVVLDFNFNDLGHLIMPDMFFPSDRFNMIININFPHVNFQGAEITSTTRITNIYSNNGDAIISFIEDYIRTYDSIISDHDYSEREGFLNEFLNGGTDNDYRVYIRALAGLIQRLQQICTCFDNSYVPDSRFTDIDN